ncbi:MAG: hypothetical protein JXP73_16615 [Deltaproteobacteria bacterium]|nr:hypothetical protein [Deltaproteobacteria bacterium]
MSPKLQLSLVRSLGGRRPVAALVAGAVLWLGCDGGPQGKDPAPASGRHLAQVSVRLDLPSGSAPAVSVLAFRAEAFDVPASDVLGAVDPLVAPAPESSCELRDAAGTARALRTQGGMLNLEELDGVSLEVETGEALFPAPRVYPPLADVVAGVIAEAGPLDLGQIPDSLTLTVAVRNDEPMSLRLALPAVPAVADSDEAPLDERTSLSMTGDLVLRVSGPPRTFLEIRPFGAPSAIACAVTTGGWVVVPHDLLTKLVATAGRAPVSFEAVWRDSRLALAGSETTRVSLEARSSAVLDLRP